MRFVTLLTIAAIAAADASAQETPDTLVTVKNASELTVTRTADAMKIIIEGLKDKPDFYYEYSTSYTNDSTARDGWNLNMPFLSETPKPETKNSKYNCFEVGIEAYVGTSIPTGDTPVSPSFEIGLSRIINGKIDFGGGFSFNLGAGIGYQQYAVGAGKRFDAERQHLILVPKEEGTVSHSSRLRIFRLHIPMLFTQSISRKAYVTAGVWLNLNTGMRASTHYTIGSIETQQSFKDLHPRILTTDIVLAAGFRSIGGLYVRYTPQNLFRNGWGPDFNSVSVGYIFNF